MSPRVEGRAARGWLPHALLAALLLAGFGTTLALATTSRLAPGAAQATRNWPAGPLSDGHTYGQTLRVRPEGLSAVRFWLVPPRAPQGQIALLVRLPERDLTLPPVELPAAAIGRDGALTFPLPPLPPDPARPAAPVALKLTLEPRGIPRDAAPVVVAGPDAYPDGTLLRDGRPVRAADLAFAALYRSTGFDPLLPISRIAAGRPGLLGWPPLYALAAYAVVAALALFALALGGRRGPANSELRAPPPTDGT